MGTKLSTSELARTASVAEQLEALETMSMTDLVEKYLQLFGFPARTRNKPYLRKKLAWRIQELAEGGLSPRALQKIEELAPLAPVRWRTPLPDTKPALAMVATALPKQRDPRLPPPGAVLTRLFRGVEHRVTVLESSFEYEGERYPSLSVVARHITGTPWNGFLFFNLQRRCKAAEAQQ
jgi:hypothetical protein